METNQTTTNEHRTHKSGAGRPKTGVVRHYHKLQADLSPELFHRLEAYKSASFCTLRSVYETALDDFLKAKGY